MGFLWENKFVLFFVLFSHFFLNILFSFLLKDKTFGLKNKKGAKQQKFIQQVQNQVKGGNPRKVCVSVLFDVDLNLYSLFL